MDIKQAKAEIESLRTYRMSFVHTAFQGEFIVNGIIIDRIIPPESAHSRIVKIDIKEIMLRAIDHRIDHLIELIKEEENESVS